MPEQLPIWNAVGAEPPTELKTNGWQPGMKPSAQHMNWLFNRAYKCLEELQNSGANITELSQTVSTLQQTVTTQGQSFTAHLAESASLTQKGHVQLSSATDSISEILAATPYAVKLAMDKANEAFTLGNNVKINVVDELLLINPSLPLTHDSTWQEIITVLESGEIGSGKKFASGTVTSNTTQMPFNRNAGTGQTLNKHAVTVTGLDFNPTAILISCVDISNVTILFPTDLFVFAGARILETMPTSTSGTVGVNVFKLAESASNLNGFTMPVTYSSREYTYLAVE